MNSSTPSPSAGMQVTRPPGARQGMLSVVVKDKQTLYASYMPFIKNGGLFVNPPSNFNAGNEFQMGNEVFMLLTLLDDPQRIPVAGKVIWITPERAEGNRASGFGIQFNDQDGVARNKIEALLAGAQESGRPTHTM